MPKVMVSLPADLLEDIDREAARRGMSRSGLLAAAARHELDQQDPAELDRALQRARAALRHSGVFESAELVRAERER
jgi:metal-responsive CopG/Arc/MetJ family transcriptional regulator